MSARRPTNQQHGHGGARAAGSSALALSMALTGVAGAAPAFAKAGSEERDDVVETLSVPATDETPPVDVRAPDAVSEQEAASEEVDVAPTDAAEPAASAEPEPGPAESVLVPPTATLADLARTEPFATTDPDEAWKGEYVSAEWTNPHVLVPGQNFTVGGTYHIHNQTKGVTFHLYDGEKLVHSFPEVALAGKGEAGAPWQATLTGAMTSSPEFLAAVAELAA